MLFGILFLSACLSKRTYTFKFNINDSDIVVKAFIYEYNSKNEVIETKTVDSCTQGLSKNFMANDKTVKIKIEMHMSDIEGIFTQEGWIEKNYYLNNDNTPIIIDKSSILSPKEP